MGTQRTEENANRDLVHKPIESIDLMHNDVAGLDARKNFCLNSHRMKNGGKRFRNFSGGDQNCLRT